MKFFTTLFFCCFALACFAQVTIDFETFDLPIDTFDNGSDLSGGFELNPLLLENNFIPDPNFPSWSGWSISTMRDDTTRGFTNQYSAISASGFNGSGTYGVSFGATNQLKFADNQSRAFQEIYVNNGTYAYYSILEGDQFARKFGGETGEEPDFFLLTIKGWKDGLLTEDSIDFYLADYRFENNAEDYIISEWTPIDLSSLQEVDSLEFTLTTTVFNNFGPATPFYFCIDQIQLDISTSVQNNSFSADASIFPNPVSDWLNIEWSGKDQSPVYLINQEGKVLQHQWIQIGLNQLNLSTLSSGQYWLRFENELHPVLKK